MENVWNNYYQKTEKDNNQVRLVVVLPEYILCFGQTDQSCVLILGDLLKYLMENEDCFHLCIVAFSIEVKKDKITFIGLFNNKAPHSPALSLAMLDNILFMSTSGPNASITVFNKPQPTLTYQKPSRMYVFLFFRVEFYT